MKERVLAVAADAEASRLRGELTALRRKYEAALGQLDREKQARENLTALAGVKAKKISRARPAGKRPEATAILVCSEIGRAHV